MKYEVILLSDNLVFNDYGTTRYMGPYALSGQLNSSGIPTLVIDYFTRIDNFFEYLSSFLSPDTLVVGISSTFLFPPTTKFSALQNRSEGIDLYYKGELWFEHGEMLVAWTERLKQVIKMKSPHCRLVLGGVKAQFAHWRPEHYRHFDNIFFGASDASLVEYVETLRRGLEAERFIRQSSTLKNQTHCPAVFHHKRTAIQFNESLPIEISRGCLYDCKFCHYEKKQSQRKDLKHLKEEMISNYETFGTTVYSFCDDCFNDTRRKVEETCNMFLQLPFKIEWVAYARPDVAVKFRETVDLMLESGARGLYWGIESFHFEAAKGAGKGTHPELIKDFFLGHRPKFRGRCLTEGSFIIGLPGEDKQSLEQTFEWLMKSDVFDFLTFGPLGLMPYSEKFDNIVFDYADYSRNPQKYGFTKVELGKEKYWEHALMNSHEARDIATHFTRSWRQAKGTTKVFRTMWLYPHFRTLGFGHEDIFKFLDPAVNDEAIRASITERFLKHLQRYHKDLIEMNRS